MTRKVSESRSNVTDSSNSRGVDFEDFRIAALSCRLKVGRRERKYAKDLLDAAKSNIRSCRLLYEQEQYAESIFFLEQAAEKTDKALLLSAGLFSMEDLRRVGHDAFRTSNLVLERGALVSNFMDHFDPQPDNPDSVSIRGKSATQIARASRASIMETVAESEKHARGYLVKIEEWLQKEGKAGRIDVQARRRMKSLFSFMEAVVSYAVCVTITHYTSVHAVSARYPGKLGPKDYTPELGIVAATSDLAWIVENAISGLERLFPEVLGKNSRDS